LGVPSVGHSQEDTRIAQGTRVRIEWMGTTQRHRAVGTVHELRADSLVLADRAGVRTFALARLSRIDVRVPRSRGRGAARGAGLGALAGLAVGLAVGAYGATHCRASDMCGYGWVVGSAIGGPIVGLALGAIVGAGAPGERWQRVGRER
jgi:hypothetical protein